MFVTYYWQITVNMWELNKIKPELSVSAAYTEEIWNQAAILNKKLNFC